MDAIAIAKSVTQACLRPSQGKLYGEKELLVQAIAAAIRQAQTEARREGAEAMRSACLETIRQALAPLSEDAYRTCRDAVAALNLNDLFHAALDIQT